MLAVIKTGGKQYKVAQKKKLRIEKINTDKGREHVFNKVLLISDEQGGNIKIGAPYIEGAQVMARVVSQGKAGKINVVKYKSKTRYYKRYGHRQPYTEIEITDIKI